MTTNTALLDRPIDRPQERFSVSRSKVAEPLLREALGESLRSFRTASNITLRELADKACVSPGYLSELERGCKEVSSEVLASVCYALEVHVADVVLEAARTMAAARVAEEVVEELTVSS